MFEDLGFLLLLVRPKFLIKKKKKNHSQYLFCLMVLLEVIDVSYAMAFTTQTHGPYCTAS